MADTISGKRVTEWRAVTPGEMVVAMVVVATIIVVAVMVVVVVGITRLAYKTENMARAWEKNGEW